MTPGPMSALPSLHRLSPLVLGALLAACGPGEDPRVEALSVGISKDSAVAVMGGDVPSRVDPYLTGGQYIEALLYVRPGGEPSGADSIPDRQRTPLVIINGLLTGWGWAHWDSVASANNIPVPPATN